MHYFERLLESATKPLDLKYATIKTSVVSVPLSPNFLFNDLSLGTKKQGKNGGEAIAFTWEDVVWESKREDTKVWIIRYGGLIGRCRPFLEKGK